MERRPCPHVSGYIFKSATFSSPIQKFPSTRSVLKSNSPLHTHPTVSVPQYWFIARRDWARFFLIIGCGFLFFKSVEQIQKYPDSPPNSYMHMDGYLCRGRGHRRRRAYAPTSITTSHDNHEKINSCVSVDFLYEYGTPLGGLSGCRRSIKKQKH